MSCPSSCKSSQQLVAVKKTLQERERDLEIASKLGTTLIESQQRLQEKLRSLEEDKARLQYVESKYQQTQEEVAKLEQDRSLLQESPMKTPVKQQQQQRASDSNTSQLVVEQSQQIAQLKAEVAKLKRENNRRSLAVATQSPTTSQSQPVTKKRDNQEELKALKELIQELGTQNERLAQEKADLQVMLEQSFQEMNNFKESLQLSPDPSEILVQDNSLLQELEQSSKKRLQSSSRPEKIAQPNFNEDRMDVVLVESLSKNIANLHKRIKQSAPLNLNKRLRKQFDLQYLTGLSMRILDGLEQEVGGGTSDGDALWKSILISTQLNSTSPNMKQSPQLISPPLVKNLDVTSPVLALDEQVYKSLRVLTLQIGALLKDVIAQRRDANLIREEYALKLEAWSAKDVTDIQKNHPVEEQEEKSGFISPAILELSKAFLNKYRPQSRSQSRSSVWQRSQSMQPIFTPAEASRGRQQQLRHQSVMPQSQSMPALQEQDEDQRCSIQ